MYLIKRFLAAIIFCFFIQFVYADTTDTITQYGITWKLSASAQVGQFVTGDYYVVGNCTIVSITPAPGGGRNGSELNPPLDSQHSGYDSREEFGRYNASMSATLPINMKPGDALISTISVSAGELGTIPDWLMNVNLRQRPVKSACVLTCVASALPADAFRPSYCDRSQKIYLAGNLKRNILPSLSYGKDTFDTRDGTKTLKEFEDHFVRVWLELLEFGFDAPIEYQVQYGRERSRAVGIASLILMTDLPLTRKEKLLVAFVQQGIDLWGIVRAGFPGWEAWGGHGSGRKWPIIFAGKMLGDTEMQQPTVTFPNVNFGEDMQTLHKTAWTGAKVVYAGHQGVDKNGNDINTSPGWGQYEHLQPKDWPIDTSEPGMNENYRRCCTSSAWVGEALAARILHTENKWNHDAFFDYVDRWMTEDDTQHVQTIKQQTNISPYPAGGLDYSNATYRQKRTWDPFVDEMWAKWRNNLPPDLDGTTITTTSGGGEERIVVYPNPAVIPKSSGKTIKLTNFIPNATINIYNAQGVLITTIIPGTIRGNTKYSISSIAEWDSTNNDNEFVPAGIYYCVTDDGNGNKRKGKIALVRE